MHISPVQVRHDRSADVTTGLLENADNLSRSSWIPTGMDDDGAAELRLSVSCGLQHFLLALRNGPAGPDLSDNTAAYVSAVGAVKHLADNDVSELTGRKGEVKRTPQQPLALVSDKLVLLE